jgi:hypothetical protein
MGEKIVAKIFQYVLFDLIEGQNVEWNFVKNRKKLFVKVIVTDHFI